MAKACMALGLIAEKVECEQPTTQQMVERLPQVLLHFCISNTMNEQEIETNWGY